MGGWFSFGRSKPLHINSKSITKLTSMRNKIEPHRLASYTRKKGAKGFLAHYNLLTIVKGHEEDNDYSNEKRPSAKRRSPVIGQNMITKTIEFFRNTSLGKKDKSNIHSMTRKHKDTNSAKARDKSLQQKINKVKASCNRKHMKQNPHHMPVNNKSPGFAGWFSRFLRRLTRKNNNINNSLNTIPPNINNSLNTIPPNNKNKHSMGGKSPYNKTRRRSTM